MTPADWLWLAILLAGIAGVWWAAAKCQRSFAWLYEHNKRSK